ncbi:MAG: type II secretion system F family protein [Candidatus Omnitrophica bacterium]|nr:type II secretion system F family protein [Candidatus Omnitrophota bacterium]
MSTYAYKARNETGKPVNGVMEASSQEELAEKLRKLGYMPTQIKAAVAGIKMESLYDRFVRIKTEDLIMFNIQLSNMIDSGFSILNSLRTIASQVENRRLRSIITEVSRSVEAGSSFSEALARHPRVFSTLFINSVRAGETSGKLNIVLNRLAVYVEQEEELRQQVQGALFYPVILLLAGVVVILLIVTFVIPQFVVIFEEAGVTLPLPTLVVYQVGMGLKKTWYLGLLGIALVLTAIRKYFETDRGGRQRDQLVLCLPVVGAVVRKVIVSRFSRTLATLVESGVPLLQSLDIVRDVVGNQIIASVVTSVRESVEKGERIAQPLRVSGEFPQDAVQMIAVGEETGKLGYMLNRVADFYDTAVKFSIRKLTTLIEPVLLIVLGITVGFIMASMLLPMFDMIKTVRA